MSATRTLLNLGRFAGLTGLAAGLLLLALMALGPAGAEAQSLRSTASFFTIAEKHGEVAVEQTQYGDPIDVSAYRDLVVNLGIEAANLDADQWVKLGIQSCNHPEADDWQSLASLTVTEGVDTPPKSSFTQVGIDETYPMARYIRWSLEFQSATSSQSAVIRASAVGHQ